MIGGVAKDPGAGIVVNGLLPPTFTGNSLWYTNVTATNILGTRWLLSGCALSNLTVVCAGSIPVHLMGCQANVKPVLSGNVTDLQPF